jgi:hypothetical protein
MSTVKDPPEEGQVPAPVPAPTPALPMMRWDDAEMVRMVVTRMRVLVDDVQCAAEDQLQPRRKRRLGHLEASRMLGEAFGCIDDLLAMAERSLPPVEPEAEPG